MIGSPDSSREAGTKKIDEGESKETKSADFELLKLKKNLKLKEDYIEQLNSQLIDLKIELQKQGKEQKDPSDQQQKGIKESIKSLGERRESKGLKDSKEQEERKSSNGLNNAKEEREGKRKMVIGSREERRGS